MRRIVNNIRLAVAWLAVGFVFVAGVSKCVDLVVFRASLNTWTLIPLSARDGLAILVPVSELVLPLLWFTNTWRIGVGVCLSLMMLAYAGLYIWHWALGATPDCGCVSPLVFGEHMRVEGLWLLARNVLLAGLVLSVPRSRKDRRSITSEPSPVGARAFTLVELLVVIAIVAVLVGITIPALATMRARARLTQSLANLRSHAANITAYTTDFKGGMPYLTSKARSAVPCPCRGGRDDAGFRYFLQSHAWHWTMVPGSYASCESKVFYTPETLTESLTSGVYTEYLLPCVFFADPAYWNSLTHEGPSQWRPTKIHEVSFPSDLSMVVARRPYVNVEFGRGEVSRVAFVDGSAQVIEYAGRDGGWWWDGPSEGVVHTSIGTEPLPLHTIDGVRGRNR